MAEPKFSFTGSVRPVCEIGLSSSRQAEPSSWLDVSCYVHEAELFRGRERFNERFEPGTASVTFSNDNGWADLGGTYAEIAAAQLRPGRQIRVGVRGPWAGGAVTTRWLYRGFVDQATPTYDPVGHDFVTVNCIDALGEAGSSSAPSGPQQGVNEAASLRMNRILDAVGWWPAKRKIDITTTKVQGTQLGSAAVDLMGQAADSAGGVVFGDLDGDVVFRDLDWMLYDPNVPPDGVIGPGVPGPPPVDHPPYLDPGKGAVYDPDDPPSEHPPKVCACADGASGTILEKGDNYKLYVKDGHLYYETSGTTWDLGPYSGGCTCVEPPHGGGGPVRTDDPEGDGTYIPNPFVPIPTTSFAVELLEWNDGGLADPPATGVAVTVTPGHDCLLVVLIDAIGSLTNSSGLAPAISGGGLDWAHRRDVDRTAGVASSIMALAAVGRDDPGTFPVTATWATGMTSRSHIVTVWKVTGAGVDYLSRFDAGSVLYALATSTPPEQIQPGNGPVSVHLLADRQGAGVFSATRLSDITIAQTLAEEGTQPFGATFAAVDPAWVIPPNVPPLAVSRAAAGSDDFERPDGPLGPDWVTPVDGYFAALPMSISGGAAVPPSNAGVSGNAGMARSAAGIIGNQFIEAVVTQTSYGFAQNYELEIGRSATDASCFSLYVEAAASGWFWRLQRIQPDPADFEDIYAEGTIAVSYPATLRLESTIDGTLRATINGTVVSTVTVAPIPSGYVAFGCAWSGSGGQPRFESVSLDTRVRKTSWTAGYRTGVEANTVTLADVNTGPSNIQSAQAALVLEGGANDGGWRLLGVNLNAPTGGTSAGTFGFNNAPRPGALLVVMVGLTASSDVLDSVTVGGAGFSRAVAQHKAGSSFGQGAVFTAVAPLDLNPATWNVTVGYPACDTVSAVVYEVTQQDDDTPLGGTASGVLGTNAPGSVNGESTITLSQPADAAAVVLAYVHVAAPAATGSGVNGGDEDVWTTEYGSSAAVAAYFQTMSRAPGGAQSTSQSVTWHDVQRGTALSTSGVELAIEIHPFDGLPVTPAGFGVALGGVTDAWDGTINRAWAEDPDSGETIWEFP